MSLPAAAVVEDTDRNLITRLDDDLSGAPGGRVAEPKVPADVA